MPVSRNTYAVASRVHQRLGDSRNDKTGLNVKSNAYRGPRGHAAALQIFHGAYPSDRFVATLLQLGLS